MSKLFGQCPSTVQGFFNSLDTLHAYSPKGLTLLCPKCPKNPPTGPLYIRMCKSDKLLLHVYTLQILWTVWTDKPQSVGTTGLKPVQTFENSLDTVQVFLDSWSKLMKIVTELHINRSRYLNTIWSTVFITDFMKVFTITVL